MPLYQALALLQRPPAGWRHYLNLDAAPSTSRSRPRRGAPLNRAPFDELQAPAWLPPLQTDGEDAELNLWLGGGPGTSQLHVDPYDNVITVVKGVKHILMFPPSLAEKMSFHGGVAHTMTSGVVGYRNHGRLSHFSALTFPPAGGEAVECAAPAAPAAVGDDALLQQGGSVTLRVGEALYLPAGWAHQVTSEAAPEDAAAGDRLHAAINMWFNVPQSEFRHERWDELQAQRKALKASSNAKPSASERAALKDLREAEREFLSGVKPEVRERLTGGKRKGEL
jgi:hypothetical protein